MPLLSVFGTPAYVGPSGWGAAAKLVANTTLFGVLGLLGVVVALGDARGLRRDVVFDVLAAQAERRRPALDSGDFPLRFRLALVHKDVGLVLQAAAGGRGRHAAHRGGQVVLRRRGRRRSGDRDYSTILAHIATAQAR